MPPGQDLKPMCVRTVIFSPQTWIHTEVDDDARRTYLEELCTGQAPFWPSMLLAQAEARQPYVESFLVKHMLEIVDSL